MILQARGNLGYLAEGMQKEAADGWELVCVYEKPIYLEHGQSKPDDVVDFFAFFKRPLLESATDVTISIKKIGPN